MRSEDDAGDPAKKRVKDETALSRKRGHSVPKTLRQN